MELPLRLNNLYDSHVHWFATGNRYLDLRSLTSADDVKRIKPLQHHFRGEWLIGFGWDHSNWTKNQLPTRKDLDQVFPNNPVAFSRVDGHSMWLNTKALKIVGVLTENEESGYAPIREGGEILLDEQGIPNGILIDHAMALVFERLPQISEGYMKDCLYRGMKILNEGGFTHIRDLTCEPVQWNESCRLSQNGQLSLAVEQFFNSDLPDYFERTLKFAKEALIDCEPNLRVKGIKIYFDGALGSDGAFLSKPYGHRCDGHTGLVLMKESEFKYMATKTWESGLELAVHAIGDQANHQVVQWSRDLYSVGIRGRLNIEHAQTVRHETINWMRGMDIVCHMQPCHWISDRKWLRKKLGSLYPHVFPWKKLDENNIPIHFGSDSPIERAHPFENVKAFNDSPLEGIPFFTAKKSIGTYFSHPDNSWIKNTWTELDKNGIPRVYFKGKRIY